MMMVMTESGLSCSPQHQQATPSRRPHQRTGAFSSSSASTIMAAAAAAAARVPNGGSSSSATAPAALERSHSYTDSMLTATIMEGSNNCYQQRQRRLTATITEVLHSLTMLSTETVGDEADERTKPRPFTGVEEELLNHNSVKNGDATSFFRRSSIDMTMLEEEQQEAPPPPLPSSSSLQTPVMQRQTLSSNLNYLPPTHKRDHSASWSSNSIGLNYAASSRHLCSHSYYYGGGGGGGGSASNKKSRSGSFLMVQSAPHLPLSPELDASRSSTLCFEGMMPPNPTEDDEAHITFEEARPSSGRVAAPRDANVGEDVPMVWKSHIQLPPPLFSPLLYQSQSDPSGGHHAAAVAAAANSLAVSLSLQHPEAPQRRDDVDHWTVGEPPSLLPPPLQPELQSFDEHDDHHHLAGDSDQRGPRLQQRRPLPPPPGELSSTLFLSATSSSSMVPLPPPMPLMSSPSPSPKIGRRILRMRKADKIDLALP